MDISFNNSITFFHRIRQNLIGHISRELTNLGSARVQTTTWIRFRIEYEDRIIDSVRPFNSRMTDIFQGSDLNEIIEEMFTHMKTQIENLAMENSRFIFDEVLFLDINFYQLNLLNLEHLVVLLAGPISHTST